MNRPTDPDGTEIRWLSYEDLGRLRGISTASATRLAFRRRWRRQKGNDGTARVAVPVSEITPKKRPERAAPGDIPNGTARAGEDVMAMLRAAREWLVTAKAARDRAERELEQEREQRITAEGERDRAEAELAQAMSDLERAEAELAGLRDGMAALEQRSSALEEQIRRLRTEGQRARDDAARLAERLVAAQTAERELIETQNRLNRLRRRGLLARILNREA